MKKKERILVFLLVLVMVIFSACSNGGTGDVGSSATPDSESKGSDTETEPSVTGEEVVLTYACWDKSQLPVYEELFRKFEEENPGIKVESQLTPWKEYWTKLETSITGSNAPDIFWLNIPRSTDYIINDVILPLDDLSVEFDKFPKAHIKAYTHDGVLYGMPKDFDTMGLWYNREMFDKAGIDYPTDDWTWEDLESTAEKLTDAENDVYGIVAPLTWQGGYYETIYQAGGWTFSEDGKKSGFDDPNTIKGVQFWADLTLNGISPPVEVIANSSAQALFESEKAAMFIEGSYLAPVLFQESDIKDKIDVARPPKGETWACTSNALAHVISSDTKHPAEAKKLIEYLSTKEANVHVAESGVVIPSYEGSQDAWVKAFPDKNAQIFIDMVEYAVPLPNALNSSAAIEIEGDILARAWNGEITVEEACKEIAQKANEILNN